MATTVEMLHDGALVASHVRSRGRDMAITVAEHRPKSHQTHLESPPSLLIDWARKIGPNTSRFIERMLADKPHPEMGYPACLGIMRLAKTYSHERMEAASEQVLLTGACRYRSVESTLKNSLDRQPLLRRPCPVAAA